MPARCCGHFFMYFVKKYILKIILSILLFILSYNAKSQTIVAYIDSILRDENPELKIDTGIIYMLGNAMALDKKRLNALEEGFGFYMKTNSTDIIKLEYISAGEYKILKNEVAIVKVTLKGLQSNEEIKNTIEKVKQVFDTCISNCPIVILNDEVLDASLCKKKIKKLKLKKIKAIIFNEKPSVKAKLNYNENIKYGLVKIWTK
jgi:hypothetical protein